MKVFESIFGRRGQEIDANAAHKLIKENKKLVIIDARKQIYFDKNRLKSAINVPVEEMIRRLKELEKYKNKDILVYCQTGIQSKSAAIILRRSGFENVYNLKNGLDEYVRKMTIL